MDDVDKTLQHWRQSAFVWGDSDCMLSIGDHVAACGGPDITDRFRGRYSDEAGAHAIMQAAGGQAGIVDSAGLPRVEKPARGDIVLIETSPPGASVSTMVAGLCTGEGVAVRRERGAAEINLRFVRIVQAWEIKKCVP